MEEQFYSIADLCAMTMLSDRTIRTCIKNGTLQGRQIRGKWYFTKEQATDFLQLKKIRCAMEQRREGWVKDFYQMQRNRPEALLVLDFPCKEEKEALCRTQTLALVRECASMKMSYCFRREMVRILLCGEPGEVSDIQSALQKAGFF